MSIIENYKKSLQEIYDHVGFTEDWVIYPIDDRIEMFWEIINNNSVRFAETMEKFNSEENYYEDEIYTQRFYKKWVYEGEKYTMIFCDPMVDGMKWFGLFDNEKKLVS